MILGSQGSTKSSTCWTKPYMLACKRNITIQSSTVTALNPNSVHRIECTLYPGLNVYDHNSSAPPDHILFSSVPRGNWNLPWMPLFSSPVLSPVRWEWREVKTLSASGHPREVFKAAISAGWHWIPGELSPRGLETEEALSRGLGGGVKERGMCDNGYCWVDPEAGLPQLCLSLTWTIGGYKCYVSVFG